MRFCAHSCVCVRVWVCVYVYADSRRVCVYFRLYFANLPVNLFDWTNKEVFPKHINILSINNAYSNSSKK